MTSAMNPAPIDLKPVELHPRFPVPPCWRELMKIETAMINSSPITSRARLTSRLVRLGGLDVMYV